MRHPMIYTSTSSFTGDKRTGEMILDLRVLDQLVEKAAEGIAGPAEIEAATALYLGKASPLRALGYAQGVHAALAWIAGQHAEDRLTALLDIDEDQR